MRAPGPVGLEAAPAVPQVPGTAGAERAVERHGGRVPEFRAALAAGLRHEPGRLRDLAALAGWRSGVVGLRRDALARAADLPARAAAAALRVPESSLRRLLEAQRTDPFARADAEPGALLHRAGGFTGLGGAWSTPPVSVATAPGGFHVRTADDADWWLEADAWGVRLTRGAPEEGPVLRTVAASIPAPSHLVELRWRP